MGCITGRHRKRLQEILPEAREGLPNMEALAMAARKEAL